MLCPKCSDVELEPVGLGKLGYLACASSCEGVWVERVALEKFWGKKRFKTNESSLELTKGPSFDGAEKESDDIADIVIDDSNDDENDDDDELDFVEEDEKENEKNEPDDEEDEFVEDLDEDDEEDDEIEEVHFGDNRYKMTFINDEGEYDENATDDSSPTETFSSDNEILEDDDEDGVQVEEESFFWTSPVSGNPMKRYAASVNNDKFKCYIGLCEESDAYWVDGSEEVLTAVMDSENYEKTFPGLLCYDRPEEEIFEDDEDDDDL